MAVEALLHIATQTLLCFVPKTSSPNSFPHYKPIGSKSDGSFSVKVVKAIMKKLQMAKWSLSDLSRPLMIVVLTLKPQTMQNSSGGVPYLQLFEN